jgi:hypothetical protein
VQDCSLRRTGLCRLDVLNCEDRSNVIETKERRLGWAATAIWIAPFVMEWDPGGCFLVPPRLRTVTFQAQSFEEN